MKKQFSSDQEKQSYLNKLLLSNYVELADDAITLLNFPSIVYNPIEHTTEYFLYLVQYYAGIVSYNFKKINENEKYTIELQKWELANKDISYYLNTLILKAGEKIVNKIYYNSNDILC
jgi:hypothetical protein